MLSLLKNKDNNFTTFSVLAFLTIFIFLLNFGLWNVYFQQDEWYWFGQIIIAQHAGFLNLLKIAGFHFTPLSTFLFYIFYSLFQLHWQWYSVFSIIMQIGDTFLVFLLLHKLFKNQLLSLLGSIFFSISNVSQQPVTWYAASLNVLPATFFGLLSILTFYLYYNQRKIHYLWISLIFLLIGLGFKEDIMSLFLFYSICLLVLKPKFWLKNIFSILLVGFIYFSLRFYLQLFTHIDNPISHVSLASYVSTIFTNTIFIPITSIPQLFLSPLMIFNIGYFITRGHEAFFLTFSSIKNIDIFVETSFLYSLTITVSLIGIILTFIFLKKNKKYQTKKTLILIFFVFCSFLPYFLLPKGFGMESRHYYFPMIAGTIIFCHVLLLVWKHFPRERMIIASLIVIYFCLQMSLDRQQMQLFETLSYPRIIFVHNLQKMFKKIPNNVIFYSNGDLPFQSGMGQMLQVIFNNNGNLDQFLARNYLWDMNSQGYLKINMQYFGYFNDKILLEKTFKEKLIPLYSVYGFYWDNKKFELKNISNNIRKDLSNQ